MDDARRCVSNQANTSRPRYRGVRGPSRTHGMPIRCTWRGVIFSHAATSAPVRKASGDGGWLVATATARLTNAPERAAGYGQIARSVCAIHRATRMVHQTDNNRRQTARDDGGGREQDRTKRRTWPPDARKPGPRAKRIGARPERSHGEPHAPARRRERASLVVTRQSAGAQDTELVVELFEQHEGSADASPRPVVVRTTALQGTTCPLPSEGRENRERKARSNPSTCRTLAPAFRWLASQSATIQAAPTAAKLKALPPQAS